MPVPEFLTYTIEQLIPLFRTRRLSPVEVTRACLERIDALDKRLCAYTTVLAEQALEQARRAEKALKRGEALSPLHGVPVSAKDVFETKNIPTTWGAKALAGYLPPEDSTVILKLREAGAILLGKTNVDVFPYNGGEAGSRLVGSTRNPWDLRRTAGLSSGGSGASVAALMGFGSVGTDTGGSIRIPAAYCGVVGLMPTFGLVSKHRVFPYSHSFDHCGPLTRSVYDCALLLSATVGHDPNDSTSADRAVIDYTRRLREPVRGLRVGLPRPEAWQGNDPEVTRLIDNAVKVLAELGMQLHEIDLPYFRIAHWSTIVATLETTAMAEGIVTPQGTQDLYGAYLCTWTAARRKLLLDRGVRTSQAAQQAYKEIFRQIDLIVMPTTPIPAPRFDEDHSSWQRPEETFLELEVRYARLFNLIKSPAISIPCGFASNGMPVGLQIASRPFEEETVLQVAYAYERASDWHLQHPMVS